MSWDTDITLPWDLQKIVSRADGWEDEWKRVLNDVIVQRGDVLRSFCRKRGGGNADDTFISWLYLYYWERPQVLDAFDPEKGNVAVFLTNSKILKYRWMDFRDEELGRGCGKNAKTVSLYDKEGNLRDVPAKESWGDDADFMATLAGAFNTYVEGHVGENEPSEEQAVVQLYPYLEQNTGEGIRAQAAMVLGKIGEIRPDAVPENLLESCHDDAQQVYQAKVVEFQRKIQVGRTGSRTMVVTNRKLISLSISHLFCPLAQPKYQYELLRLGAVLAYQRVSRYRRDFLPLLLPERLKKLADLDEKVSEEE